MIQGMIKEEFEIDVDVPSHVVLDYLRNFLKFKDALDFIKDAKLEKDNEYSGKVKLSFIPLSFDTKIIKNEVRGTNSSIVTYNILRSSWPSFSIRIDFIITPNTQTQSKVKCYLTYTGYMENLMKAELTQSISNLKKEIKTGLELQKYILPQNERRDKTEVKVLESINTIDILSMKTIYSGKVSKKDLKNILERAILESVQAKVLVMLSDTQNTVNLEIQNGDVTKIEGDINSLQENIIVLIKKRE
jgi:carbon monoxide dehydrogenase subunit G